MVSRRRFMPLHAIASCCQELRSQRNPPGQRTEDSTSPASCVMATMAVLGCARSAVGIKILRTYSVLYLLVFDVSGGWLEELKLTDRNDISCYRSVGKVILSPDYYCGLCCRYIGIHTVRLLTMYSEKK